MISKQNKVKPDSVNSQPEEREERNINSEIQSTTSNVTIKEENISSGKEDIKRGEKSKVAPLGKF